MHDRYRKGILIVIVVMATVLTVYSPSYRSQTYKSEALTSPVTSPLTPTIPMCASHAQGDSDCNGVIELRDFETWRKEYIGERPTLNADFNRDNQVSIADFEIWRNAYF